MDSNVIFSESSPVLPVKRFSPLSYILKLNLFWFSFPLIGIVTGWSPGKDDASMFELLADSAEAKALPAVCRWLGHIASFTAAERAVWP